MDVILTLKLMLNEYKLSPLIAIVKPSRRQAARAGLFNMLPKCFGTFSCLSLGTLLHIVEIMFIKCYVYLEIYFVCFVFYCLT